MSSHSTTSWAKGGGTIWVHLAAIVAVTAWGVSFVNTKVLMDHGISPVQVYLLRCILAYILLLAFSWRRILSRSVRHEMLFVLCGLCGGSVYFIAENTALLYTSTTNVSLITSISPLISALLVAMLYRDERPGKGLVIGSAIALAGVATVVLSGAEASLGGGILGDILSLMAAICWSVYALVLRKLHPFYSAIYITRKTFFYGFITALPMIFVDSHKLPAEAFRSIDVWVNLITLAVFASSLAFVIWAWVVGKIGAVKAGNYCYFQPIVTMIFSVIMLGDILSLGGVIGCLVTIGGVVAGEKLKLA